jgi:hypothetical protein
MSEPFSWKEIEPGWRVFDTEGNEIGRVDDIAGDPDADIFDGLTVGKSAVDPARSVPSASVAEIREREVHLSLTHDGFEALPELAQTALEDELEPEPANWYERISRFITGHSR